jgi:hypothetical protein
MFPTLLVTLWAAFVFQLFTGLLGCLFSFGSTRISLSDI